jgi:Carboxypeptidase regulatory-like domain
MKEDGEIRQVAYVKGRILHEGTGRPVVGDIRLTADEGVVSGRVFDDGTFVVSAYEKFPALHLNVRAASPQYRAGALTHTFVASIPAAADFDPTPPAAPAPLVDVGDIILPGDAVNLRGRVTQAADPDVPVVGADVALTHAGPPGSEVPPAATDGEGRFRFDDVRLWAPSTIGVTAAGFKPESRALVLDYERPVNEEDFRLQPPP